MNDNTTQLLSQYTQPGVKFHKHFCDWCPQIILMPTNYASISTTQYILLKTLQCVFKISGKNRKNSCCTWAGSTETINWALKHYVVRMWKKLRNRKQTPILILSLYWPTEISKGVKKWINALNESSFELEINIIRLHCKGRQYKMKWKWSLSVLFAIIHTEKLRDLNVKNIIDNGTNNVKAV